MEKLRGGKTGENALPPVVLILSWVTRRTYLVSKAE